MTSSQIPLSTPMAYNVQKQLNAHSVVEEALAPLKPKLFTNRGPAFNPGRDYSDTLRIEFADGEAVELEGWHVRDLLNEMDRDRMAAIKRSMGIGRGIRIPDDISFDDFRDLYLLSYIYQHKIIQNAR